MANWGALSDVQARLTYKTISTTSNPTSVQVIAWLDEAESFLRSALVAIGLPSAFSGDAAALLGKWATDYAEGRTRMAWASADGSGVNDDGVSLVEEFNARIEDILNRPDRYGQLLLQGTGPQETRLLASHVTYNLDNKSPTDFPPIIKRDEQF